MFIVPMSSLPPLFPSTETNAAAETAEKKLPFSQVFEQTLNEYKQAQEVSNQDAYDLSMGTVDDLHTVTINSAVAASELELTVRLTTLAVNAYKEVIQMQV